MFSGRADPRWPLSKEQAGRLRELWAELDAWEGEPPRPPGLGYRGCFATSPDGATWTAFAGAVTLVTAGGGAEVRVDPRRQVERLLLESAPAGAVPPGILGGST